MTIDIERRAFVQTGANTVERAGEIAGGVRERAVKIEKYRANVEPRRRSEPIRHVERS